MTEQEQTIYDNFIRSALAAGFTDDQVNFLENWVYDYIASRL